jgi:hypothetical protein
LNLKCFDIDILAVTLYAQHKIRTRFLMFCAELLISFNVRTWCKSGGIDKPAVDMIDADRSRPVFKLRDKSVATLSEHWSSR